MQLCMSDVCPQLVFLAFLWRREKKNVYVRFSTYQPYTKSKHVQTYLMLIYGALFGFFSISVLEISWRRQKDV